MHIYTKQSYTLLFAHAGSAHYVKFISYMTNDPNMYPVQPTIPLTASAPGIKGDF